MSLFSELMDRHVIGRARTMKISVEANLILRCWRLIDLDSPQDDDGDNAREVICDVYNSANVDTVAKSLDPTFEN